MRGIKVSAIDSKYLYIINKATTNTLKQQVYHVQKPGMISQECWLLYIPCTFCIIWPGVIYTWYNRKSLFSILWPSVIWCLVRMLRRA